MRIYVITIWGALQYKRITGLFPSAWAAQEESFRYAQLGDRVMVRPMGSLL